MINFNTVGRIATGYENGFSGTKAHRVDRSFADSLDAAKNESQCSKEASAQRASIADFSTAKPDDSPRAVIYDHDSGKLHITTYSSGYIGTATDEILERLAAENIDPAGMSDDEIYNAIYEKYWGCFGNFLNDGAQFADDEGSDYAKIIAQFNNEVSTAQAMASSAAANEVEKQQDIITVLLSSGISPDKSGSYPTQEQLDYLTEKYGDMDFSAYRSYDNVKQYANGSWGCNIGTGYSDAYDELLNDLYDMGVLTAQDKSLLGLDLVRVGSINELGGFDFDSNISRLWRRSDLGLSLETALSGRGSSIDLIE